MNLEKKHDGMPFTAIINNVRIKYGKIRLEDEAFYLCQDLINGNTPVTPVFMMGFKKAWCVGRGTEYDIDRNGVQDLSVVFPEWDELTN